jgi:hypothetical protein
MRVFAFILFSVLVMASCKSNDKPGKTDAAKSIDPGDSTKFTTVQWMDSLVDFGSVAEGQKVNVKFRFKNTGTKPLIVASVVATCGCTVPEYTQEPVMPGGEGYVKAVFNSSGQPPTVHKTIHVAMNTKEQSYPLSFIGEVTKAN